MKTKRWATPELIHEQAVKLPFKYQVLLALGMNTGARVSELLSLKLDDIIVEGSGDEIRYYCRHYQLKKRNHGRGRLEGCSKVTKTLTPKIMLDYVLPWMKSLEDRGIGCRDDWLFPGKREGEALTRRAVGKVFLQAFGKGYGSHFMRRTYGRGLYFSYRRNGKSMLEALELVRQKLGHSSIIVTMRYIGIEDSDYEVALDGYIGQFYG